MVSQTITGYKSSTCNYVKFEVVMTVTGRGAEVLDRQVGFGEVSCLHLQWKTTDHPDIWAARSSETLVLIYQYTRRHVPEESNQPSLSQ
jgi:hypothetical protein